MRVDRKLLLYGRRQVFKYSAKQVRIQRRFLRDMCVEKEVVVSAKGRVACLSGFFCDSRAPAVAPW